MLRRAALASLAATVLLAGCGGDDDGEKVSAADREGLTRVSDTFFAKASTPEQRCRALSTRFVLQAHRGRSACIRRVRQRGAVVGRGIDDTELRDISIDGNIATARVTDDGKDDREAKVRLRYRREGGTWRIDGFGRELLTKLLESSLEQTRIFYQPPFDDPGLRKCANQKAEDVPPARISRILFAGTPERVGQNLYRIGAECFAETREFRALFRAQLEKQIAKEFGGGRAGDCLVRRLRRTATSRELAIDEAKPGEDPSPPILRKIQRAAAACG